VDANLKSTDLLSAWPFLKENALNIRAVSAADKSVLSNYPKISVVTPNYNYEHFLERTILSVLQQEYPNLEYIIIDDGSTDSSCEIIKKYEKTLAYWEHQSNKGQYSAINKGFSHATGDIFAWINSDDIYLPWTFRVVAEIFNRFPEVEWIIGRPSTIQNGIPRQIANATPCPREFIQSGLYEGTEFGFLQQESMFWRRSVWEKAGELDVQYRFAADFELWTRFAEYAELVVCETPIGGFWLRDANRSRANLDRYRQEMTLAIDRLPMKIQKIRQKILKINKWYYATKAYTGVRRLVRRTMNLQHFKGKVLRWNFDDCKYELTTLPFYQ
jgi:glycosyltransferase involved in cell wall biosynthesis